MTEKILPVVLAGGSGTRLWPRSRAARPKQFIELIGNLSLYQQTLRRIAAADSYLPAMVISNADHRFLVLDQAEDVNVTLGSILLEPMARSTALAIACAAFAAQDRYGDSVLHVLPSDHLIEDDGTYPQSLEAAAQAARDGWLVTFGINPKGPETGYGYIATGDDIAHGVKKVARFIEKPDVLGAERMLAEGGFLWNSGMFMVSSRHFLDECQRLAPETHAAARKAVAGAHRDLDFLRLDAAAFTTAPDISVDYAIFEHTKKAAVLPASFGWSDLGAWDAVWRAHGPDANGNVSVGPSSLANTKKALVVTDGAHVVVDGLEDVTVIASEDAIYVGRLSQAGNVGNVAKALRANDATRTLAESHKTEYRPWGGFSSILMRDRFQVKRLFVKPGKRLSLQKHHHRSEHWIVVRGTAEVTLDDKTFTLTENESVYLPLGCTHRLGNPGKILLELIEVQTGSYLGDDDIIRLEDEFGRA